MRYEAQTPQLEGCVRAAWQTQLAAARQTPGLLPVLLRHRTELLPRFAATYTALRALPRRVRRALHRTGRASLASVALWLVRGQELSDAATILVGRSCTLVRAIRAANMDRASGGCPAGRGADTIVLPANSTHTLTQVDNSTYGPTGLPVISSPITIMGRGSQIQRANSAPEFRLLAVNSAGTLTLQETAVSGGMIIGGVEGPGGGIANFDGTVTMLNSTIIGNAAYGSGGGVTNYGTLTIQHSTISGNAAPIRGGGVHNSDGILTLQHNTITGNAARFEGGGVWNGGFSGGHLTLARTLASGNAAPAGAEIHHTSYGTVQANDHHLFGVNGDAGVVGFTPGPTDVVSPHGVGLTDILDPTLAANGGPTLTHALVPGSPALDAIPVADPDCTGTDQRGVPRPQGVGCDIGAVEGGAPTVVSNLVTLVPLPATFQTSTNVSGCPPGFVGTFRFTAQWTAQASSPPLVALVIEVETLSNGNLVQNAVGGPGGVGARVPVPPQGRFADGQLSANEAIEVPLVVCLRQKTPFQFFVDVLGLEQE